MRTSKITREQALEFRKAPELLEKGGVGEDMIYTVCSHGYGICSDKEPVHEMEKVRSCEAAVQNEMREMGY